MITGLDLHLWLNNALATMTKDDWHFWTGSVLVPCGLAFVGALLTFIFALIIARYVRFHQIMQLAIQAAQIKNDSHEASTIPPAERTTPSGPIEAFREMMIPDEETLKKDSAYLFTLHKSINAVQQLLEAEGFFTTANQLKCARDVLLLFFSANAQIQNEYARTLVRPKLEEMEDAKKAAIQDHFDASVIALKVGTILRGAKPTPTELWPFPHMFRRNSSTRRCESLLETILNRCGGIPSDGHTVPPDKLSEILHSSQKDVHAAASFTDK